MQESPVLLLPSQIDDFELLYRCIIPFSVHWNFEEGRLSSGCFKSSKSISVDRSANRLESDCLAFLLENRDPNSGVVKITVNDCVKCSTKVTYDPISSEDGIIINPFHCLIDSVNNVGTNSANGKCLSKNIVIVKSPLASSSDS